MEERPEDQLEWRLAGNRRKKGKNLPRRLQSFYAEEIQDGAGHFRPSPGHEARYRTPSPLPQRNRFGALQVSFSRGNKVDILDEASEDEGETNSTGKEFRDRSPRKDLNPQPPRTSAAPQDPSGSKVGQASSYSPYPVTPTLPQTPHLPSHPSIHPSIHPPPSDRDIQNPLSSFVATNQPMTQDFFKEFMLSFSNMVLTHVDNLRGDLQHFVDRMSNFAGEADHRISKLEHKIAEMSEAHNEVVDAHSEVMKEIEWIKAKLADGEDRNRRNNIRIRGVPETVKTEEIKQYVVDLLKNCIPTLTDSELTIDRAHRLPKPAQIPKHLPRDVIFRVHFYHVKEQLLAMTRGGQKLADPYQGLTLFQDLSKATLDARREFYPVTNTLRHKGIDYSWGFNPPKLVIRESGEKHLARSPQEGLDLLYKWKIPLFVPRDPNKDRPFKPKIGPKPITKPLQSPMDTSLPITPEKDKASQATGGE